MVDRGEIHETNAVRKFAISRVGHRDSEAGLPHAAGAHKGHKSCKVECSGHALDVTLPDDALRRLEAAVEFTGGTGVDHVVEVGGAATLTRSFGAIRVGGKVTLIGGLSGGASELNPALIFARRANVQGISVGSTEMFEAMNRAIAANAIKPVIDKVFDFAEVQAAYRHMAAGAHFGKIVIRIT